MEEIIKWTFNRQAARKPAIKREELDFLSQVSAQPIEKFIRSFPQYQKTPLRSLKMLADRTGVGGIYVKDESYRFGLNSFKVLGGGHAIGRYLAGQLGLESGTYSYDRLRAARDEGLLDEVTFTSATDGNHGRGVAWAARQLGHRAVINMPRGSAQVRLDHIISTGAEGYITAVNYDQTVRLTAEKAREEGWVVIQDTAWEGYENIPTWVMQGYTVMAAEALQQLREYGVERPTHIFIQAGVGSLAGAVLGFFASMFYDTRPITVVVEPNRADCFFRSALAGDGEPHHVTGDLDTIMAGLACGEPNPFAWRILNDMAELFISCPDYVAAQGMRIMGNPLPGDRSIVSGESGAVTAGALYELLACRQLEELRKELGLGVGASILLFSTEGDTDPQMYRDIVWNGAYPRPGRLQE